MISNNSVKAKIVGLDKSIKGYEAKILACKATKVVLEQLLNEDTKTEPIVSKEAIVVAMLRSYCNDVLSVEKVFQLVKSKMVTSTRLIGVMLAGLARKKPELVKRVGHGLYQYNIVESADLSEKDSFAVTMHK